MTFFPTKQNLVSIIILALHLDLCFYLVKNIGNDHGFLSSFQTETKDILCRELYIIKEDTQSFLKLSFGQVCDTCQKEQKSGSKGFALGIDSLKHFKTQYFEVIVRDYNSSGIEINSVGDKFAASIQREKFYHELFIPSHLPKFGKNSATHFFGKSKNIKSL